jgi:hypothetical protein
MPNLEEVFKLSGVPTYTFVQPAIYNEMKVSIRTPGRCCVVEGPSGIGKTTSITKILDELGVQTKALTLSGRRPADIEMINELPDLGDLGVVIVDDFHRLPDETKKRIADFMKVLADQGSDKSKLVLIGINKAGDHLVTFGHDLGLRLDVFKMEANPSGKISELIHNGEAALNVEIADRDTLIERSMGSFQIAQLLCHDLCVKESVTETLQNKRSLGTPIEVVIDSVMIKLRAIFYTPTTTFARGSKLRPEGRAPYLFILKWLADGEDWFLDLREALKQHVEHRGSVGQVLEKGFLATLLKDKADVLDDFFHFENETGVLSVEDPRLVFYLKNLTWKAFARQVGYKTDEFAGNYDLALSFAGEIRTVAGRLYDLLAERQISVFYDNNEQHRILAEHVEEYLAPIYRNEAAYVVPLLSKEYPKKIWTKFESDNFKHRFGENAVIPIRFTDVQEGFFSNSSNYGGLSFDPTKDHESQLQEIATTLAKRLADDRQN